MTSLSMSVLSCTTGGRTARIMSVDRHAGSAARSHGGAGRRQGLRLRRTQRQTYPREVTVNTATDSIAVTLLFPHSLTSFYPTSLTPATGLLNLLLWKHMIFFIPLLVFILSFFPTSQKLILKVATFFNYYRKLLKSLSNSNLLKDYFLDSFHLPRK